MKDLKEYCNPFIETFQKHYYILWTISFGLGIYAGNRIAPIIKMPQYCYYAVVIFMFFFLSASFFFYLIKEETYRRMRIKIILFPLVLVPVIILFLTGLLQSYHCSSSKDAMQNTGTSDIPVTVCIMGRVTGHPKVLYGDTCFDLSVRQLQYIQSSEKEEITVEPRVLNVNVRLESFNQLNISRDDFIKIRGRIYSSGDRIIMKSRNSDVEIMKINRPYEIIWKLRQKVYSCIKMTFERYLGSSDAHLAEALVLGNRDRISDYLYDAFKESGTAHLIAISGMHISFLALIVYMFAGGRSGKPALAVLIIIILLLYNFLIGSKASVERAIIWAVSAVAAESWHRENAASRLLCISFIMLLVINPGFSDDAGFWLSFSAMSGIVFIYPVFRKISRLFKITKKITDNYFAGTLMAAISVQIACGPVILYYFGSLPLVSPLSNVCILMFFYPLIFILFLSAFLSIIWPPAAGFVLKCSPVLFDIVKKIAVFFSGPWAPSIENIVPSTARLFIYYLLLFSTALAAEALIDKRFDFYR